MFPENEHFLPLGERNISFSEILVNVLNEWSLTLRFSTRACLLKCMFQETRIISGKWISKVSFEEAMHEKCPNTELFLVRIFLYSDWIRRFSPNRGKYGPEITPYLNTFHEVKYATLMQQSKGASEFRKIKM